jgi:hypothetical protein
VRRSCIDSERKKGEKSEGITLSYRRFSFFCDRVLISQAWVRLFAEAAYPAGLRLSIYVPSAQMIPKTIWDLTMVKSRKLLQCSISRVGPFASQTFMHWLKESCVSFAQTSLITTYQVIYLQMDVISKERDQNVTP